MKIVVDIPDEEYKLAKLVVECGMGNSAIRRIMNGKPLPEGAEILTKEAYSDLCLRASHERKTGKWIYHIDDLFPMESTKECDQCRTEQNLDCDGNFCPWCGVRMEGAEG